jgi:hypothetical protein
MNERQQKIQQIRERIERGTYVMDMDAVAEAVIRGLNLTEHVRPAADAQVDEPAFAGAIAA